MVPECVGRLIERPSSISGYRTATWCAVCGRTGSSSTVKRCFTATCPNLCHADCLGEDTDFKCGNTVRLRSRAGISDPVTFQSSATPATSPLLAVHSQQEAEGDLNDLGKEELVKLVKDLRLELASTQSQLQSYGPILSVLKDTRQVLVETLKIADDLAAIRDNSEIQLQKYEACAVRPQKIREEGAAAAAANQLPSGGSADSPPPPYPSQTSSLPSSTEEETLPASRENTVSSASKNETESQLRSPQHLPQQGNPQVNRPSRPRHRRKKRSARTGDTALEGETAPEQRRQPRYEATPSRLQQQK